MTMNPTKNYFLCLCLLFTTFKAVNSINCYQCSGTDSDNPFECTEYFDGDIDLVPQDCGTIHNAQYCIKHVGRFEGVAIDCYQCNSSSTMECGDGLMKLDGGVIRPTSCEHVYDARYCIKQSGPNTNYCTLRLWQAPLQRTVVTAEGGISTKRFCSSLDLGNYCNYVQQPGDKLEYRTCIYTCGTDGCNAASSLRISSVILLLGSFLLKYCTL